MAGKILITAFEPFGIKGALTKTNSSRQVLYKIQESFEDKYDYLILPAKDACEDELGAQLAENEPAAIVSMGEFLTLPPNKIRFEPAAVEKDLSVLPRLGRGNILSSVLSQVVISDDSDPDSTGIGLYYCNRVYVQSLEWARKHNKPAVFFHIPVLGDRNMHFQQVMGKICAIEDYV